MTRFALAFVLAATIGIAASTLAEEESRQPRPGSAAAGNFRQRLLKEFDADGDGKLNGEEQEKAKAAAMKLRGGAEDAGRADKAQLMKQFDKDGDGQLSDDERAAVREFMAKRRGQLNGAGRPPQADGSRIPPEAVKRFDTDGDGQLDKEELQAAMKARGEFMKRNGAAGQRGRPGAGLPNRDELIKKFDKNGDGKLDEAEQAAARAAVATFRGQRPAGAAAGDNDEPREPRIDKRALLEKFDTDGDGKLSGDERAKAREEFKNRKDS